jgi:hypothetical protein
MRVIATSSEADIASETNVTIRTDAVLEICIVRHIKIRNDWAEIEEAQEADVFHSITTFSSVIAP